MSGPSAKRRQEVELVIQRNFPNLTIASVRYSPWSSITFTGYRLIVDFEDDEWALPGFVVGDAHLRLEMLLIDEEGA